MTSPTADGRDEARGLLDDLAAALDVFNKGLADAREETERKLVAYREQQEKAAKSERRRFGWKVVGGFAFVLLLVVGGLVWQRGQAADAAAFDRLAQERYANCQISQVRTTAHVELVRAELADDEEALRRLTGPGTSQAAHDFAHAVFDGQIAAARAFLDAFPDEPIVCTDPDAG